MRKFICKNCGKTFYQYPSQRGKRKKHKIIFCSRKCMGEYQRGENNPNYRGYFTIYTCKNCGKQFRRKFKLKRISKFCSHSCALKYLHKIGIIGKGSKCSSWKGGITPFINRIKSRKKYRNWMKAVKERDNYTCQWCGYQGKDIIAHHIKSFSKYPKLRYKLDNGVTLCKNCHKRTKSYGKNNQISDTKS